MTNRQRILAILRHQKYDRLPLVHYGFWPETLFKWASQGHITQEDAANWINDGTPVDLKIGQRLGFDLNWANCFVPDIELSPVFEEKVVEELPDGYRKVLNNKGVVILKKQGKVSIPQEFDHLLKDRASWEKHYLPKLQFSLARVNNGTVSTGQSMLKFIPEGLQFLKNDDRENPVGIYCSSLIGQIRNWLGVESMSYLCVDDENLFDEIINTISELAYRTIEASLKTGAKFDSGQFWEDICFKNGPLISPLFFENKIGPHYKRITDLLKKYGVDIVSVDCDGCVDALIPIWLKNGINTMFPIEVGTWNASIKLWRQKYGSQIRGIGGVNKNIFAKDFAAIDAEIERLKPLVELGGFVPCPDHRIAPDAEWDNVRYYCDKMRMEINA
ncbi:MAG: uroporphyrinogen decarboxylase family protein [Sedimentisphaerales bacterium]